MMSRVYELSGQKWEWLTPRQSSIDELEPPAHHAPASTSLGNSDTSESVKNYSDQRDSES